MKVLIICNSTTGLVKFRGMLIQELINKGNIVKVIVPSSNEKKEHDARHRVNKMQCDLVTVPIERRGLNLLKDLILSLRYKRIIKKEKPDLIITYTIKPNIYGGIICRILGIPYITNITGLGTAFQKGEMLKQLVILLYKIALKRAKIVFFENNEDRNMIVTKGIVSKSKTYVLAGAGVDLVHFSYKKYPEDNEKTRFLFIGRVMQEKGIDELFQAMTKLNQEGYRCSLDVLGGYEENYSEDIAKCEREGWLNYHGYQEDVRPFIENCHCFVLPSWHEGMANTNLESAAMGRPVITSDIHGCLESVENETTGYLCKKKDSDDLYQRMKNFIELSYEERKSMGIAGRKRMEEIFDKRAVVKNTIDFLYKE